MGNTRNVRSFALELTARAVLVVFVTGLVPMFPAQPLISEARADAESVNPGFDATMPPQFNTAQVAGQGQLFQNCNGQLQQSVMQGLQSLGNLAQGMTSNSSALSGAAGAGAAGLGYGISAVCPGTDVGPTSDSMSCENLTLPDGSIDRAAMQSKAVAIEMALANVQCKKGKFAAIQGQLQCLTAQADSLTQQLTSIQSAYQTNIQRMQQDVQKINQVVSDRQTEDTDVLTRLNGDAGASGAPGNGSKGLIGVRDGLCKALTGGDCGSTTGPTSSAGVLSGGPDTNSIPGQIQTIKDQMTDAANKQQQLTEAINEREMGLAGDCFNNRKEPQFQCVVNGPPVSAHDYVLCMYQQKLGIDANGQVDNSALTAGGIKANQNAAKAQGLGALLDQIMGDVPQKTQAPAGGSGGAPDPSQIQAATILTAADVETQYGSQLAAYDTSNDPIHDFVMKNVSNCFQRAQKVVKQEKNMASSPIGQQQTALNKANDDLKANARQMLSMNVSKYEEAMTALTGMNMPLNTGKCNGGTPAVQVACLQDLQSNMEALLHGSAKQTTVTMNLQGTDPNTNISFSCQGLNGCITALQNVDRNLKSEVKRVQAFKQKYVTAATQSVDNFTKQMAAMMSSQGAALNNKLKELNTALASLGVSGGISIPAVKCDNAKPAPDADGLPGVPSSSLATIGCAMNPPMLDVSGSDFSSALSNVASGSKDLDAKLGPLNEAKNKIASLGTQCLNKSIGRKLEAAQRDSDVLANGHCEWSDQFCGNTSALQSLTSDMSNLDGVGVSAEAAGSVSSALEAGMGGCAANAANRTRLKAYQECVANQVVPTDGSKVKDCGNAPAGYTAPSPSCASIVTRLRRDVANIGTAANGGGNAGGAR